MKKFKYLLWLMFFIMNCSQPLHAAQCVMRGEWMNAASPALGSTLFEQEGNRIWVEPTTHPYCGQNKLEGTTDGCR